MGSRSSQVHLRDRDGYDSAGDTHFPGRALAPTFTGTIGAQSESVPLDVSSFFASQVAESLSFSAGGLPDGLTMDSATGITSGTTTETGTHRVRTSAKDSQGVTFSNRFNWVVA